jgi:soluble lytic murein transglycosylase-like protein
MLLDITRAIMRYLAWIGGWSAALGALFAVHAWAPPMIHPTDDFLFSLAYSPNVASYHLLNERKIASILAERLDSFPSRRTLELARHLLSLCEKYRFEPAFILSLIEVESRFRTKVVSPAGAVGLMQLMPSTARFVAESLAKPFLSAKSLEDPFVNLTLGLAYLASLRDRYLLDLRYSPYHVLAAYNVGPARLNQLMARKNFKPTKTRKYYEDIRRGMPQFRSYQEKQGV